MYKNERFMPICIPGRESRETKYLSRERTWAVTVHKDIKARKSRYKEGIQVLSGGYLFVDGEKGVCEVERFFESEA